MGFMQRNLAKLANYGQGKLTEIYACERLKTPTEDETKETWKHVINAGCRDVLNTGTVHAQGGHCWKGFTDSEINKMMIDGKMKVHFPTGDDLFVQLTDTKGNVRPWQSGPSNSPDENAAKWRWSEENSWRGPCTHPTQYGNNYRWFHFKAPGPYGSCASSNDENSVRPDTGFRSPDTPFFPTTGWNSGIKLYVLTKVAQ